MSVEGPLPSDDLDFVVRSGERLWGSLHDRRLLITGATGFFGRWLVESLLAADDRHGLGISIEAPSRNPGAFLARVPHLSDPRIRWVTGSPGTLNPEVLGRRPIDLVIHLATEGSIAAHTENPKAAESVIVDGTRQMLEVALRLGARRFLFTSSGAVYGPQPAGLDAIPESYAGVPDENDPAQPYGRGGASKREAERLCEAYSEKSGLCAVIARCFAFAGPALPLGSKFAFGNFMGNALAGEPIVVKGDGTQVRTYLYGADLAVWLLTLLFRGESARPYNVGSEKPINVAGLAEIIACEVGSRGIDIRGKAAPGSFPERYVPSTERARRDFALRENFTLPEMVRRTAAWHRFNRKH
jgi:nucleoside-diphosphate-sugar epimerase